MEAEPEELKRRVYNVQAMSFTPEEIATEIKKRLPHFTITYNPCPVRQAIGYVFILCQIRSKCLFLQPIPGHNP